MTVTDSNAAPARPVLLIVDDDQELCSLLVEYLTPEGFAVELLSNGMAALERLAKSSPDLVVLDVMLPEVSGFEVLRRIRAKSAVPVIMLTARGEEVDRVVGLEMGADDYLPKPFEPDELFARVKSILRRIRPSLKGLSFISIGDIELDEPFRRVTRGGEAVELTGAEFSLLQLLISRPGTAFSRQELIPRVLSRQESGIDRSIDSLVSNLRRKLGPFPDGSERIRSIRGVGYVYLIAEEEAR